ncbi:hypothetical protein ACQJBY_048089 [Aegilops geniculata]
METKGANLLPNLLSFLSRCSARSPSARHWRDSLLLQFGSSVDPSVVENWRRGIIQLHVHIRVGDYSVTCPHTHGSKCFSFVLTTATCASADLATYIHSNPHSGAFVPCFNHFMLLVPV